MNEILQVKLQKLPTCPGCYLMKSGGQIIYVGKAVNLKNRVSQYFGGGRVHTAKVRAMVSRIDDFDIVMCDTNLEALILECNLIKLHRPQYNILLKDDKHYPYLRINVNEPFPQVEIVRRVRKDGARYFGPYSGTTGVNATLDALRELFPLRTCSGTIDPTKLRRPCLHHQIGECPAPCAGLISPEEYGRMVQEVCDFLTGHSTAVLERIEEEMKEASQQMRFEQAVILRDRLKSAQQLLERQKAINVRGGDQDIIACAEDGIDAMVQVLFMRQGHLIGAEQYALEGAGDQDKGRIFAQFLMQFYDDGRLPPSEILCQENPEGAEDVAAALVQRTGARVLVHAPQRGTKHHLVDMAARNADDALEKRNASLARQRERTTGACADLVEALGLKAPLRRIEGYDISNTQGVLSVAGMVVALNGVQSPKEYRRFRIRTVEGANDFASMGEVLTRRFSRAKIEREVLAKEGKLPEDGEGLTGFADLPDLILIDGGPEQLRFAREAMLSAGFDLPIFGLAKRLEEIFLPGCHESILLDRKSPALHLVQRIRDEAHRFCITYHRELRQSAGIHSQLENIPGIGPTKRRALLTHFKSIAAIRDASPEMLCQVPGIGPIQAKAIRDYFDIRRAKELQTSQKPLNGTKTDQ